MLEKKQQRMHPPRTPKGTLLRKGVIAAWSFSRLCRVSDSILFQMTLVAALLATVLGKCGPPPTLLFASPIHEWNQTDFNTGTSLRYTCRPGYSRVSSQQNIVCKSDGLWHYNTFCVKKRCRNPGDLPNGQVEITTDLSFGSQIKFSCSKGYILVGSTTSHCEIQDKGLDWSDPLPVCVIAQCELPPNIANGKHSGGGEDLYTYGSSVTYYCDPNFSLLGNASISCTVVNKTVGVWSPSPPTCEKISCSKPDVPHGKIISGFGPIYSYKDSIMFTCQKGFILRGSRLIHCEANNNWNPSPPTCERNGCVDLPDIPHASWVRWLKKEDVYLPGTVLRYSCHSGYQPATDEPMTVTCQRDFSWSPFKGCKEVCCPKPEVEVVKVLSRKTPGNDCAYIFEDEVSYTCHENKILSATCQSDGTWGPRIPSCDPSCDYPPSIAHGHYTRASSYSIFKQAIYECDEGYTLVGEAKLSCSFSHWSPAAPQCKALCLKPKIDYGKLSVEKDQYGEMENLTVQCDSGFAVVGPQSITCSENGTWYPEVPKCEWEVPAGCEQVLTGRKLMQCLPSPEDVKMALEVYKLSLEIELLELQRDKARLSVSESSLEFF